MSKNDSLNPKKTLFVDIGNSSIKVAFKKDGSWQKIHDNFKSVTYLISWLKSHKASISNLIVASVRRDHFLLLQDQIKDQEIISIRIEDIPSDTLNYSTPKTLGIDRYLGCLGAFHQVKKNIVVVDAGSACTIDAMDENGIYQGGSIMPGLQSILTVFKSTAPELPEIDIEIPAQWPGKSTAESLQWGQVVFFLDGINCALDRYKNAYGEFDLFLTGGDAEVIQGLISEDSKRDEFLIFKGMEAFIGE